MMKFKLLTFLFIAALSLAACTPKDQQTVQDAMEDKDGAMMDDETRFTDDEMPDGEEMMDDDAMIGGDAMMEKKDDAMMDDGDDGVVEFSITGKNFEYSQKEIRVKQGDRVRINFTSESGFHDWVVDAFGVRTEQVLTGASSSVEFVASQKGNFEFYCSVGNHRGMGMVGNLIVE